MAIGNHHYEPTSRIKREMSLHAQKRASQRGISEAAAALVIAFGEREHDNHGGVRYLMTPKALDALRRAVGSTQKVEALAGVYAVVSTDGQTIITLAHHYN